MYRNKFLSDLDQFFPHKEPVCILALSGGPDSIFLGELLTDIFPKEKIVAAHFNHALRNNSDTDCDFCEDWAKKKGVRFVTEKWKTPKDSEEKARTARRDFLLRVAQKQKADVVFLGTHDDDEAETILFHFLRGTGISGLSGIQMFDSKTCFLRPLLRYTKKEIVESLKENNIDFIIDPTNLTDDYSRNYLRNKVIPLLEERFPGFSRRITRQAKIFARVEDFLQQSAKAFLQERDQKIAKADFIALHPAVQTEVIRLFCAPKAIDSDQTEYIREFIVHAESGKKTDIGKKRVSVYSEYFFVEEKP
jgi:tRNA(Ile)-lysidine synthase